jgi:hypothetical protein
VNIVWTPCARAAATAWSPPCSLMICLPDQMG